MKAIVLAGGADQIALIHELKNKNYETILIDYYDNPVAKFFADKHIVADTLDIEKVKNITKYEKVDLIITACTDQALLTMAKASEELNLPCYISYETALNVTNKLHMKQLLKSNNIPTADYLIIKNNELYHNLNYPLVVKPADCNSSKGVIKCINKNELNDALTNAINYSRTKTAIVEEYKFGKEISVDFFVNNGEAIFLCATSTMKKKNSNTFTITQSYYPILTEEQETIVKNIGQNIVNAFKLVNTPLLIQLILTEQNEFFVLEFSARMGGGSKYKLIEVLTGLNIMKIYVDFILNHEYNIKTKKRINYASMNYIYCYNGIFNKLLNFDDLIYFQYKSIGTEIKKSETSSDRVAGFLLTADTHDELIIKTNEINKKIKVLDNFGNDIARHDLIEETL